MGGTANLPFFPEGYMGIVATIDEPKIIKFKLLRSRHIEGKGQNAKVYQTQRDPVTREPICPIIETTQPLDKMFNAPGRPKKFERITEVETPEPFDPLERQRGESIQEFTQRLGGLANAARNALNAQLAAVDKMSKDDLEQFAEDEEIDIEGAKTIEAIKAKVKAAIKGI